MEAAPEEVPNAWHNKDLLNRRKSSSLLFYRRNAAITQGDFAKPFANSIEEHEMLKVEFHSPHGVVWTKQSRVTTPCLSINGF